MARVGLSLLLFLMFLTAALSAIDVLAQSTNIQTVTTTEAVNATTVTVTRTVVTMSITTTTVPVTVTQTVRVTVHWGVDPNVALWIATAFAIIALVVGYILGYRVAKRGAVAK